MNSLNITLNEPIRFLGSSGDFTPVRLYKDGVRTDEQGKSEKGILLWQMLRCRAEVLQQVCDDVTVVVASNVKPQLRETGLSGVSVLEPPIEMTIRARATGNNFADLQIKLTGNLKQGDK